MKAGWQLKTLAEVCQIKPPKAEARRKFATKDLVSFVPMGDLGIDQKVFKPTQTKSLADVEGSYTYFADGDVLLAKITPCFENGKLGIAADLTNGVGFGSSEFLVFRPSALLDKSWLYYFLSRETFREEGAQRMSGAVGHKRVAKEFIQNCPIPIPPLLEQRRIVGLLDEALSGIARAASNVQRNVQNAQALFESCLRVVFDQSKAYTASLDIPNVSEPSATPNEQISPPKNMDEHLRSLNFGVATATGGREATSRRIAGDQSLAVGIPNIQPRSGWHWFLLSDLARLESGHTPSRRHPDFWGGSIGWIGIADARQHHGERITSTSQTVTERGIEHSSARVLPRHTVCLSRTASVGYVVVMDAPMATSQDFVNWICGEKLDSDFLKYLFLAEGRKGLLKYASGSVHQTIYFPEAKAFAVCIPKMEEQRRLVAELDCLREKAIALADRYSRKLADVSDLKNSLLSGAFAGAL